MGKYGVRLERSRWLQLPLHPDAHKEESKESFDRWCAEQKGTPGKRLAVDLFSGAGGLSLGLERAGWTVALAVDHDRPSLETHRHNFPGFAIDADLGDPAELDRVIGLLRGKDIDMVAGGPPCQPFSRAGRSKIRSLVEAGLRDVDDRRRELWQAFLKVVLEVEPRVALMENVPDMALGDDLRVVRQIVTCLEDEGYNTQVRFADASRYGVPQHRKRLILLARKDGGGFDWPECLEQGEQVSLNEAIGDLPPLGDTTGGRVLPYEPPTNPSPFAQAMRRSMAEDVVWDHMTRPVRDDDREAFASMNSRTLYADIPERLRRYKADTFDDKYKRLGWDELSRSITAHIAKDGYWYIHPGEPRTLTVREAARIQTFPDHFRFAGTRSHAFRQIGNAVPPALGKAAAHAVRPVDPSSSRTSAPSADSWRQTRKHLTDWAREERDDALWFALPGDDMTAAVTLAAAVLNAASASLDWISDTLEPLRGQAVLTASLLEKAKERNPRSKARIERLRPALGQRDKAWFDPTNVTDHIRLTPGEQQLLALFQRHDVLLTDQSSARVAARVAGTNSHLTKRLSDGRLDVARLVDSGGDAPLRMAALRLIGRKFCLPERPDCGACPLESRCETRPTMSRTNNPQEPSSPS